MDGRQLVKCFGGYIRYHFKWFAAVFFCGLLMAAVMGLNHIPMREIGYGLLLCAVFLVVLCIVDFYGYWKKYKELRALEHSVTVSLQRMTETGEPLQREYQILLEKLLEENQRIANQSVQKERDLTEYFTMWVHQIKTPIAALKLLLEEETRGGWEENTDGAQGIYRSEKERNEELQELFRVEQYVEMALHYMRLGSETTDFVLKRVELDTVIKEAVRKYARQFIRKKISLNYEPVHDIVLTDEKWMEFVIEQLLSNALKYTAQGSISIYVENGMLVIADTGIGIRQEDLPRVCEKGYTGYNGHEDKRSTGIGLYLCSRILKKLGHTFTITSEEGRGTRAVIGFFEESE